MLVKSISKCQFVILLMFQPLNSNENAHLFNILPSLYLAISGWMAGEGTRNLRSFLCCCNFIPLKKIDCLTQTLASLFLSAGWRICFLCFITLAILVSSYPDVNFVLDVNVWLHDSRRWTNIVTSWFQIHYEEFRFEAMDSYTCSWKWRRDNVGVLKRTLC